MSDIPPCERWFKSSESGVQNPLRNTTVIWKRKHDGKLDHSAWLCQITQSTPVVVKHDLLYLVIPFGID